MSKKVNWKIRHWKGYFFPHSEMVQGGTLTVELGEQ